MVKVCTKCGKTKDVKEFHVKRANKDGLSGECKVCKSLYYLENKKALNTQSAKRRRVRYNNDLNFKIRTKFRNLLRQSLEGNFNTLVLDYVGISLSELKSHLFLSALRNGYMDFNPDKWTSQYHIDHIIPVTKFNLTDERQLYACYNWRNLQILSKEDNIKKGTN